MDPRRHHHYRFQSSVAAEGEGEVAHAEQNFSYPDPNHPRPSPLRKSVSFFDHDDQDYPPQSQYHHQSHGSMHHQYVNYYPEASSRDIYYKSPPISPARSSSLLELDFLRVDQSSSAHNRSMGLNSSPSYGEYIDHEFNSNGPYLTGEETTELRADLRSDNNSNASSKRQKYQFKSYLLSKPYEKPWLKDKRLRRTRINNYIIYFCILASLGLSAYINYAAVKDTGYDRPYCLILDDQFNSLDTNIWNHEVQINGFGTGSFEWMTNDPKNSYVDNQGLHIVPTLTTESTNITPEQLLDEYTLNLTKAGGDGTCTADNTSANFAQACSIQSNSTTKSIIPPVRSARLTTKGKKSIKYGRIEVTAKLPAGDWLWPSIWMMPEKSVYGPWPQSGEIDIMESRGNNHSSYGGKGGNDYFLSTLHWGPSVRSDSYWRTTAPRNIRRTTYSKGYHKFGLEWTKDHLFTWVDSPLYQVLYVDFTKETMWSRGRFQNAMENATYLMNPWETSLNKNAPFDEEFFLIMNLAVGSKNGWFANGVGGKPWVDDNQGAAWEFWHAKDKWLPTWGGGKKRGKDEDEGMTVKRVRMWQEGKCRV